MRSYKKYWDTIYKGLRAILSRVQGDITSIAVAYYLLISIFPLMLIGNILPYFPSSPQIL